MATFTSSWRTYGSGAQWRLILEIDDPPPVTSGTSSVTITARGRIQTTGSIADTTNGNTLSGSITASNSNVNVTHGGSGGTTTVVTGSAVINTVYGSSVSVPVTFAITGYVPPFGQNASVSGSVTVPARPISAPAAPTNVSASRNSDTSHTITWTRTSPTAQGAPYQSQRVQRRVYSEADGWSAWVNRSGALGAGATSYTDSTTANWRYQYRVVAHNSAGSGTSAASATVDTTPSAPSNVQAAKSGSNIVVTWTNTRRVAGGVQVQRQEDGGAWGNTVTLAGSPTSWTHTSPDPAVTHRYRVRATVSQPSLQSGYTMSNIVQLAAPPNAPTGLTGPTIRDATEDATWRWTHNPVDSSPQRAFEVRHRVVGDPSWTSTGQITSGTSEWILPADTYDNPDTIQWQVRTWGQHDDPSSYSSSATSPTSTRPTVVVNEPEDESTVEVSTLTVEWGYDQAEESAQAGWQVELRDESDALVEARSGSGTATTAALATVLPDDSTWTVRARVQSSAGLWSDWDQVEFSVEYPLPPVPTVALTWDPDSASIAVEVTVPDPEGDEIEAVHVDIWRAIDEGEWVLIATGVPLDTVVTDWAPTVRGTNRYRAEAVSALPSVTTSAIEELVTPLPGDPEAVWIGGGAGFSMVRCAWLDLDIQPRGGRAVRVLHQFDGRDDLTEIAGPTTRRVVGLSATITTRPDDFAAASAEDWLDLADLPGPHLWRDSTGRYMPVSLSEVSAPYARGSSGRIAHLSLTATRVGRD